MAPKVLYPVLALTLLLFAVPDRVEAGRVSSMFQRIGPSDLWCPLSISRSDEEPGFTDSSLSALNLGRYELSFRAPADGAVEVVLQTEASSTVRVDNIFAVERARLFDDSESFWSSATEGFTDCYEGSVEENPQVRVPFFTPAGGLGFDYAEILDYASQTELENQGWSFTNAGFTTTSSATESVPDVASPDNATGADCPGDGPPACTEGSGAVELVSPGSGQPAVVAFPVSGLVPGTTYTLVLWWYFVPGDEISVDILDEEIRLDDMNMPETLCAGTFTDEGGIAGDYGNSHYWEKTLFPDGGGKISLDFTAFDVAAGDFLGIHDGPNDTWPDLGNFSGTTSPGVVTSTAPDGSLTLEFQSNASGVAPGWEAEISCVLFADGFESGTTSAWSGTTP